MSGFDNETMNAINWDFRGVQPVIPQVTMEGQLPVGTGSDPAILVGTITSPDGSLTIGYDSPNITAEVNTSVVTDLHVAQYIVSAGGLADGANYITVQDALNAANAAGGGTVFVQPGTYTENLTLYPNVNLTSFDGEWRGQVSIVGKMSFSSAGHVEISNIHFDTNSDFILELTGTALVEVRFNECYFLCSDNTAISYTNSNAGSLLQFNFCESDVATTGITFIVSTSAGFLRFYDMYISNEGGSTTASTASTGTFDITDSNINIPISITDISGSTLTRTFFTTSNVTAFTMNAAALTLFCQECNFASGTATALVITAGIFVAENLSITSSNASAISGAGTIKYNLITYLSSSSTNSVTTQTALTTQPEIARFVNQAFSSTSAVSDVTTSIPQDDTIPQNTEGTEILTATLTPKSSTNRLNVTFSIWGGASTALTLIAALFQDSTAGAIAANAVTIQGSAIGLQTITWDFVAGTAASTTLKVRIGHGGGTFTVNGFASGRYFGGVAATTLTVYEYAP